MPAVRIQKLRIRAVINCLSDCLSVSVCLSVCLPASLSLSLCSIARTGCSIGPNGIITTMPRQSTYSLSLSLCVSLSVCICLCLSVCLSVVLVDSGGVVNALDFCPASLKSLGCFYFRCVLSSQWKAVTVNLRILHCQL